MITETVKKIARQLLDKTDAYEQKRRQLIVEEAKIGGSLFGEVPKGHRRDFFYLGREGDHDVWVWHEGVPSNTGNEKVVTTRYEIYPDTIIKAQDGQPHVHLTEAEARNLKHAIMTYYLRVRKEVYA